MGELAARIIIDADELRRIRKRATAAEPAPWTRRESWHGESWEVHSPVCAFPVCASQLADPKDADFIAASREDVPNLLATVEHFRNLNVEARSLFRAVLNTPALDAELRKAIITLLDKQ